MSSVARLSAAQLEAPRAHLRQSDPRCDTVTVLNMAARRRPGRRVADMNAVAGKTTDWNLHWTEGPWLNHFTHIVEAKTGRLRELTPTERHRPVDEWDDGEILRWRKNIGTERHPKWVRPFTCAERQRQANLRGVTIAWELKSRQYGLAGIANRFVKAVGAVGGRWFVMTLVNMKAWAGKLTAFHNAGRQTALLAHGQPKPDSLSIYHPGVIDVILGRFA